MATLKLYLDIRHRKKDGTYPLVFILCNHKSSAIIKTGISLDEAQWDKSKCRVVNRPDKNYVNSVISQKKAEYDRLIMELTLSRNLRAFTALEIREMMMNKATDVSTLLKRYFIEFMESHENPKTREIYMGTWRKIQMFSRNSDYLDMCDINRAWLQNFNTWLSASSPAVNARSIHFRNIRAVFNYAIDSGADVPYPFRKFKIHSAETPKRSLTLAQFRHVMTAELKPFQEKYRDIFILSFYLIGINLGDLLNLPHEALRNGRIEYRRKKTHKLYSVKVEPEAMEIIRKYEGSKCLINFCDSGKNYRPMTDKCNRTLRSIIPGLTTYWARHTWATLASEIDIPEDVISRALGHSTSGASVTNIYINFNSKKIDDANRAVIDYVIGRI